MYGRTIENSLAQMSKEYEQIITDENTTTVTYIGWAERGVVTSAAKWIIQKIESASASSPQGVTTITWAPSYKTPGEIWDNRTGLIYS